MIKIITLSVCVALSGCAGAPIETTARYNAAVEATAKKNAAVAELEQQKVKTLGEIEKELIKAKNKIDIEKLRIKEKDKAALVKQQNAESCVDLKDDDDSLYTQCLELIIKGSGAATMGHTISGDNNNVVIGSGSQEVSSGPGKQEGGIAQALIDGMNRDPFTPIPQQPAVSDQYGPLLKFGETLVKTGAVLFGVDRLAGALETGISKPSVRINGDYVSRSNNPITSTEYAPPGE